MDFTCYRLSFLEVLLLARQRLTCLYALKNQLPLPHHELIMLLTAEAQSYKSYLRTELHI